MSRIDWSNGSAFAAQQAVVQNAASALGDFAPSAVSAEVLAARAALGAALLGADQIDLGSVELQRQTPAPAPKRRRKGGLLKRIKHGFGKAFRAVGRGLSAITRPLRAIVGTATGLLARCLGPLGGLASKVLGGLSGGPLTELPGIRELLARLGTLR